MSIDAVDHRPVIGQVRVNDVDLHVRTVGDGPAVIVLHGGPGAHHDYLLPQFDALARGRQLRFYDQRGGGRSPVARDVPVDWRAHVDDLDALIERWNLAPATLLGYSWGGLLALLYVIRRADRVGGLALVSPAPVTARGRAEFKREFERRMHDPRIEAERRTLRHSGLRTRDPDAYRRRAFALSVAGYFKDPANAHGLTPFRVTGRTQQAVWQSLGHYDFSDQLTNRSVPALVAHGRHDPVPLRTAEHLAQLLGARLEIFENSGHAPHVEEFDRFVSVCDAFLPRAS